MMRDYPDKYGRGSAAANGSGFVDLVPGDTFDGLEAQLRLRKVEVYQNSTLDISASIGSNRNANELAKHLASGEREEAHKFAAKNIGALFERGILGIRHFDKKAMPGQRWIVRYIRVFTPFVFGEECLLATITLKQNGTIKNFYSVEAVEITQDANSERTPRGAISEDLNAAPFRELAPLLRDNIAYYVGDCNRTQPEFVNRSEPFSIARATELIKDLIGDFLVSHRLTAAIISPSADDIRLRRAEPRDMRAVFELSNDPTVRANSIHTEPITWETHVAWFTDAIASPDVVFLLAVTSDDALVGQVRFNRRREHWVISISIAAAYRGRGFSKALLIEAMKHIPHTVFIAEIAETNEASRRLFMSAGFKEDSTFDAPKGFLSFRKNSNA